MSVLILRNKANPAITRQFPAKAWEILDKSLPLKKEWEVSDTLDGSPIPVEQKPTASPSFIPPEVHGLKLGKDGKVIVKGGGKTSNAGAAIKKNKKNDDKLSDKA